MLSQFPSISFITIAIVILISGPFESKVFALRKAKQHYRVGYAKGCQDGQDGKEPDQTQYNRACGFSKHTIDYNT